MRLKSGIIILLILGSLALYSIPIKNTQQSLPILTEITITSTINLNQTWSFATGGPIVTSPVFVDQNSDGLLEIVFGSTDNFIYCVNSTGHEVWRFETGNDILSSPAVADLDQDSFMDVLIVSTDGYLYCLEQTGQLKWKSFIKTAIQNDPIVVDLDLDGNYEILISDSVSELFCVNNLGVSLWNFTHAKYRGDSPVVGNISGSDDLEIILPGTDGLIYLDYWGVFYIISLGWNVIHPQEIVLADLNRTGTNQVLYYESPDTLRCVNANDPSIIYWSILDMSKDNSNFSSPVIADINSDGDFEIIIHASKPGIQMMDNDGILYCINSTGHKQWNTTSLLLGKSQPVIADIDNNGTMEIITINLFNQIRCFNAQGNLIFQYTSSGNITNTPLLIDIDNDGILELIYPSGDGSLYCLDFTDVIESGKTLWTRKRCSTFNIGQVDFDGDHIDDLSEAFFGTSPEALDTDLDDLADWQEIYCYRTSPCSKDTDGDVLEDGDEIFLYGTDPLNPDTDGDGFTDGEEIAAGTDPLDPEDYPSTTTITPTNTTTTKTGSFIGGFVSLSIVLVTAFVIIVSVERRNKYYKR